jgi:hypothetical protein
MPFTFRRWTLAAVAAVAALLFHDASARAQAPADERSQILAVTDSALAAVSRNDFVAFTDLMIDSAVVYGVRTSGTTTQTFSVSRAKWRSTVVKERFTERPFRPAVHISGPLAVVWTPYDFYDDGKWSHCGVDTFTLVKVAEHWRIATLSFSMEQPPACERHPAGPPKQ